MIQNVDFRFFFLLALVLSGNRSYEPGTLRLSNHTNTEQFFWFSLQVFRQAGPLQRVDCWARMKNKRKVSFPRTQQGIRTRDQQPFDH